MKRIFYLITIFISIGTAVKAQDAIPLSLEDATKYALLHADTLKNARINIGIQKAQNAQVTSAALPRIGANGSLIDNTNPQQQLLPGEFFNQPGTFVPVVFSPYFNASANLTASQTLFDGSLIVALKARKAVVELVTQVGKLTEENLRYGIQRAYYSIVIARRNYNLLSGSLAIARKMQHDADVLHTNGMNELIDVQRSSVQVNNLSSDSVRTVGLIESSEQMLKYQIGMDINQPIVLTDTSVEDYLVRSGELLGAELDYNNRTEFGLFQKQLELTKFNLKRYQYAALPTLSANGQVGYNYGSNTFSEVTNFRKNYLFSTFIAVQLNVPIFNGFNRKNQVKEARYNIEKTENNIHFLKQSLDFQSAQAKTTLRNALVSLQKEKRNLELANSILDLSDRKYKAGVGSSLEVNTAQTDLARSQTTYFQSLLDVINAQSDLQKSLGQFK